MNKKSYTTPDLLYCLEIESCKDVLGTSTWEMGNDFGLNDVELLGGAL